MEDRSQQQPSSAAAATALVARALRLLPMHLTVAYTEAVLLAPELVQEESDPVLFLRKTNMNVQNAAIMIAVYWTKRKAFFGQRAYLPLMTTTAAASGASAISGGGGHVAAAATTALGQLDMAAIPGCCLQVLPRDRMGHAVYFVDTQKITTSLSSEQGLRCLFYQLQRANNTTLSSTEGIIQLWLVRDQAQFAVLEAFVNLLSGLIQQAMPVNIQRLHIITTSPTSSVISSLTQLVFGKSLCEECVVTAFSSHQNLLGKLLFYGISEDCLPMELGGSYDNRSSMATTMMTTQENAPLNIFPTHRGPAAASSTATAAAAAAAAAAHHPSAMSWLLFSPGGGVHQDFSNAPLLHGAGLYPDEERTIPLGSFGMHSSTSNTVPSPRTAAAAAMMPTGLQQEQDYSNVVAAMLRQRKQQNWLEASMLDAKLPATQKRPPTGLGGPGAAPPPYLTVGGGRGFGGGGSSAMCGDLSEFSSRGSSNTSGVVAQLKPCPPSSLLEQQQQQQQQQHYLQQQQQQQQQQQRHQSDESQTAAERAEHLRQRNALYTRRSYHKSKIELQVLQDQVEQLRTQQQNLSREQERLQQLHQLVDQCLKKQKTEHTGGPTNVQLLPGAAEPAQNLQDASITSQNAPPAEAPAKAEEAPPPRPTALPSPHLEDTSQEDRGNRMQDREESLPRNSPQKDSDDDSNSDSET